MSAANLDTLIDLLDAAIEAEDNAAALRYAKRMLAVLARTPNSTGANSAMQWDRQSLKTLIDQLKQDVTSAAVASGGIRRTKINYINPGEDEC